MSTDVKAVVAQWLRDVGSKLPLGSMPGWEWLRDHNALEHVNHVRWRAVQDHVNAHWNKVRRKGDPFWSPAIWKWIAAITYYDGKPDSALTTDGSEYDIDCLDEGTYYHMSGGSGELRVHICEGDGWSTWACRDVSFVTDYNLATNTYTEITRAEAARRTKLLRKDPLDPFEEADEGEVRSCETCGRLVPESIEGACPHVERELLLEWDHVDTWRTHRWDEPALRRVKILKIDNETSKHVSVRDLGTGKRLRMTVERFVRVFPEYER